MSTQRQLHIGSRSSDGRRTTQQRLFGVSPAAGQSMIASNLLSLAAKLMHGNRSVMKPSQNVSVAKEGDYHVPVIQESGNSTTNSAYRASRSHRNLRPTHFPWQQPRPIILRPNIHMSYLRRDRWMKL
jgi:hypothetical protein